MLRARPRQTARWLFLCPIAQQFPPQLPDLFDGAFFSLIRRAACRHRLIQHVRNGMKPRQYVRAFDHPLFQGAFITGALFGSIVHEPLQLYKNPPRSQVYFIGTPKYLSLHHSLERHFQSHPQAGSDGV